MKKIMSHRTKFAKTWLTLSLLAPLTVAANDFTLSSPNGQLTATISDGEQLTYQVSLNGILLIAPSPIGVEVVGQSTWGKNSKVRRTKRHEHHGSVSAFAYKKAQLRDEYQELILTFSDYQLVVRAYDQGVAYRFVSLCKKPVIIKNETASFCFAKDWMAYVPYVREQKNPQLDQFANSFENTYTHERLSKLDVGRIAFIPILVEADNGVKIALSEAETSHYPGMFVQKSEQHASTLHGVFASYPKNIELGGKKNRNLVVTEREGYIAKNIGGRGGKLVTGKLPWRVIHVAAHEKDLLDHDLVYLLSTPSRVSDLSWIKPGKVAWDWWNNWGLYGVSFEAGVNNKTYEAYIDFAAKYGIEYVILDEGWSVTESADLMRVVPEIDLSHLIRYAARKNVGIILWASHPAFANNMEQVCRHYSDLGVKGFKIDFIDRDDQLAVDFIREAAETAAHYQLLIDFHGCPKPTGLERTYPNIVNYEAVDGLEQNKWSTMEQYDQVTYDVTIPFTRMLAGPMDYTQGAMLNSTRKTFHPSGSCPMSQGTRCHQLADYVVFFSPLNMLCDSPTNYEREPECTEFIAGIPTIWDETVPLCGEVGQYVGVARRKGDIWYVGVLNNWTKRTLTLNLDFLSRDYRYALIFQDGPNATKQAQDYQRYLLSLPDNSELSIALAAGGGYVMKIVRDIKDIR